MKKGSLPLYNRSKYCSPRTTRFLVAASPKDNILGIDLAEDDDRVIDPAQWQGENHLGFALMKVRDMLRK